MAVTQSTFDTICSEITSGRSLRSVCQDEGMPASSTIFKELASNIHYAEQYARARQASADAMLEELLEIADEKSGDPARDRLRLDTRKWAMSKMAPKKYGDKLELAGDPDAPVVTSIAIRYVDAKKRD